MFRRLQARLYRVLLMLGLLKWPILFLLALIGLIRVLEGQWAAALLWIAPALLLVIGWIAADLHGYTVFLPDLTLTGEGAGEPPEFAMALATGLFRVWDRFKWTKPEVLHRVGVQVRWLHGQAPPVLAVMRPTDLPPELKNALDEADEISLWYPGVDVTPGRVIFGSDVYPALRLQFIGKSLVLALPSEDMARAYLKALAS